MTKPLFHSPTLAETAHSVGPIHSLRGLMAGMTALAVGVSLILGTALPVSAHRDAATCATPVVSVNDAPKACMFHP